MAQEAMIALAPDIRLYPHLGLVIRGQVEVHLSPMQFTMLCLVADAKLGLRPEAIFDRLYAGANTPLTGLRTVHIQRCHANRKLTPARMRITSTREAAGLKGHGGPGSIYRLKID